VRYRIKKINHWWYVTVFHGRVAVAHPFYSRQWQEAMGYVVGKLRYG
jgi:hypothetical protein